MELFVKKWGYLAVLLGSMIEGESVILPAGYFAAQGFLNIYKIMFIAFMGSLVADQLLFFVGQTWGKRAMNRFCEKHETFSAIVQKSFSFLNKNQTFYILTFRFIYGIRIMSPVVIGAAGIPFGRFASLNVIAAASWSVLSCGTGYVFGGLLLHHLSATQRFFVLGLLGGMCTLWLGWKAFRFFKKDN